MTFGGLYQLPTKRASHTLTIYDNTSILFNSNQLTPLIQGYIKLIISEFKMYVPNGISIIIQQFFGLLCIKTKYKSIIKRCNCGGCVVIIKKQPYLIIFGGKRSKGLYLNDCHLIKLEHIL